MQCDEPATAQSDEPAAAQSEEPATTQSEEPAVTQCEELTTELAPEPIPEFLPSQPHASSDSESQLAVSCCYFVDKSLKIQSKRDRTLGLSASSKSKC